MMFLFFLNIEYEYLKKLDMLTKKLLSYNYNKLNHLNYIILTKI